MPATRRLASLPLWSRWDKAALLRRQKQIGPRAFARGYFLDRYTDEERMFRSFSKCWQPDLRTAEIIARRYPTFIGLDPSGKKRKGTAIVALALEPSTKKRIPVDVRIGAWGVPEMIKQLVAMNEIHQIKYVMVENNALQEAIVDWIKTSVKGTGTDLWFKIEGFHTGKNKTDQDIGLPSLETEFANEAWAIPSNEFEPHEVAHDCAWCTWRNQFQEYPMGAMDDSVLATYFAREAIYKWGDLDGGAGRASFNDQNVR